MVILFGIRNTFVIVCWIFATNIDCLTIGVIASGNDVIEEETVSNHGHHFILVKHLINMHEIFNILTAVHSLDSNKTIDVITMFDYDISLLEMPHIWRTSNKKLIRMGARSRNALTLKIDDGDEVYCVTNINATACERDILLQHVPEVYSIRQMIQQLKWRYVIIFYENVTEEQVTKLVNGFSRDGVLFAMFNNDEVNDLRSLLHEIYNNNLVNKIDINIIIACKFVCLTKILKTANDFDSLNDKLTLLSMFAKWVIVLYDHNKDSLPMLQNYASDLDNIVIISLPENRNIEIQILPELIEATVLDSLREQFEFNSHGAFKDDFIIHLQKNARLLDNVSKCNAFHVDTLMWKHSGRRFDNVGYADAKGNVIFKTELFPNSKFGYNKRLFNVSTLPYTPFVMKTKINNTYKYDGFCMDLLNELANQLNFTYILTEPADQNWGTFIDDKKQTYNGLVGQLQKKEVDMAAAPIARLSPRSHAMDFSYSYFYEYTTVLIKKLDANKGKWRTLIDPLKLEVLVAVGIILLVVTLLVFLLEKHNPFYDNPKNAQERLNYGGLHELHSSFWYVFGALLCQGGVHLPLSTAGRTLISCWWLTCIIVVGTYCGNLIAFLSVTKESAPFNTLEEMLDQKGTFKWGTIGGSSFEDNFPSSRNPIYRAIGESFLEFYDADPNILHKNPDFHINRVLKEENYAWIGDKTYMEINMAKECRLKSIKEEFMPMIYVFGFTKNSPHTALFSEQMIKIHEGGLFQIWKRKWWPKSNFCAGSSVPEAKPISLMDVQSAFYVCLIGVFIGSMAFVTEIIIYKYRTNLSKRQKQFELNN